MVIFIFIVGLIYIKHISGPVTATSADTSEGTETVTLLAYNDQAIIVVLDLVHGFLIGNTGIFISGIVRLIYIKNVSGFFTEAYS